jgi:anti-anti-sigma factor
MWTDFQFACDPPKVRLQITGEIDFATKGQLRDLLLCFFRWRCTEVELDLSGISFIDLSCLRLLDREQRRCTEAGGSLEVVAASPCYFRITDIAGYENLQPPREREFPGLTLVHSASAG